MHVCVYYQHVLQVGCAVDGVVLHHASTVGDHCVKSYQGWDTSITYDASRLSSLVGCCYGSPGTARIMRWTAKGLSAQKETSREHTLLRFPTITVTNVPRVMMVLF